MFRFVLVSLQLTKSLRGVARSLSLMTTTSETSLYNTSELLDRNPRVEHVFCFFSYRAGSNHIHPQAPPTPQPEPFSTPRYKIGGQLYAVLYRQVVQVQVQFSSCMHHSRPSSFSLTCRIVSVERHQRQKDKYKTSKKRTNH